MVQDVRPGFTLGEIVARCGGELEGDGSTWIAQVAPAETAGAEQICYVVNPRLLASLSDCRAGALIIGRRHFNKLPSGAPANLVLVEDAHVHFARVAQLLNPLVRPAPGVHPGACVQSDIPSSVSVGPGAWIGSGAVIGEHAVIGANCTVGDGAHVGEYSVLYPGTRIYHGCRIGARAIIHSGAVIGADGFGFGREKDGSWVKIPQIGRVLVGDDVEIGANSTIDRGAMEDTVIGNGVIIDNLVHVGHNCHIGDYSALAGCTGIAGSTKIGKRCLFGGAAMISGHLHICDDVVVSAATLIIKDIRTPGVYTSSVPSQEHASWVRNFAHLRHLDQSADRIRELEKRLAILEGEKEIKS